MMPESVHEQSSAPVKEKGPGDAGPPDDDAYCFSMFQKFSMMSCTTPLSSLR
jgi:hypothetical protein